MGQMRFYGQHITYEDEPCWLTKHWKAVCRAFFGIALIGIGLSFVWHMMPGHLSLASKILLLCVLAMWIVGKKKKSTD